MQQPDLTHLVAQIIGVIYISIGSGLLAGTISLHKVVEEINQQATLRLIAAGAGISIGLLLIAYHNHWSSNWPVIITLIGWMALSGGIIMAIYPASLRHALRFMLPENLQGALMLLFGCVMCYLGWWA